MNFKKLVPLLVLTGCMTSCTSYSSKPGRIENLVGTYELKTYTMRHEEVTEGDNTYDKKAEIGAVAYFSISKDGYAYYGYKDNSTSPKVDSMFVTFSYSEKNPKLVEAIDMTDGVTHKYDDQKCPGCFDEPKMGFKNELFSKTLNYTILSGHMAFQKDRKIPYRFVEYKRVSRDASLAKVNYFMGTNVSFAKPYEMKAMTGYAVYRCNPKDGSLGYKGNDMCAALCRCVFLRIHKCAANSIGIPRLARRCQSIVPIGMWVFVYFYGNGIVGAKRVVTDSFYFLPCGKVSKGFGTNNEFHTRLCQ